MEHDEKKNSTYLYLPIPTYPRDILTLYSTIPRIEFQPGGDLKKKKK